MQNLVSCTSSISACLSVSPHQHFLCHLFHYCNLVESQNTIYWYIAYRQCDTVPSLGRQSGRAFWLPKFAPLCLFLHGMLFFFLVGTWEVVCGFWVMGCVELGFLPCGLIWRNERLLLFGEEVEIVKDGQLGSLASGAHLVPCWSCAWRIWR